VRPRHRDGLLAALVLAATLALSIRTGASLLALLPAVAGVLGSLALEAVFLRYPDRTRALWERSVVQVASLLFVVGVSVLASTSAVWLLGALVWGLVAYLVLLGFVLAGAENPVGRLLGADDGR
jgi:amino acid permease